MDDILKYFKSRWIGFALTFFSIILVSFLHWVGVFDIIDAIQARDKTTAGRLINGHVMKSQKRFFTVFENPPIIK